MTNTAFQRTLLALGLTLALAHMPRFAWAQPLIVIDPGHGGADPGAVGCSLEEEDVVLDVSLGVRGVLEAAGIRVTMTRDTDTAVGLSARVALANSMAADGYVSIHSNANAGAPASGTETFVATAAGARSIELATLIQAAMIATWALPDRGVKFANFVVIRDTTMPAALAEIAFTNRCDRDALLMASPEERARMADAQAAAILEWLGIMPGTTGTLRGVVFEDQGVGLADLTVRIPGAQVTVVGGGGSVVVGAPDADWMFAVPVGAVTIEARAPGFVTAQRTCDVTGGATTWCSIGLFRVGATPDAGASADAGVVPPVDAGSAVGDSGAVVSADAGPAPERGEASCGCRAGRGSTPIGYAAVGLGLMLVLMRRKRSARVVLAALLMLGCGGVDAAREEALLERGATAPVVARPAAVTHVAPFATLLNERVFPVGDAWTPQVSPDGRFVLFSRGDLSVLEVLEIDSGARRVVASGPRVGHEPRWQDDGRSIAVRRPEDDDSGVPSGAFALNSGERVAAEPSLGVHAWIERGDGEDAVLYRDGEATRRISRGGDRYLLPSISSGDRFVAYWGIETGVLVYRTLDGSTLVVGDPLLDAPSTGTPAHYGHPRFDGSGSYVFFERTRDDGHAMTEGTLLVADLSADPARVCELSVTGIAQMPSASALSTDGRGVVAFVRDGDLVVAEIRVTR